MTEKNEGWLASLYRALWSRLGGRPWTYIIRDNQKQYPLPWLLLFGALGIILGHLFW
ncbi:hypothetical protein ACFLUE_02880 [Chloroflexota bacterium]